MSEDIMTEQINAVFGSFDKKEKKLAKIPNESEKAVNVVLANFADDIFKDPEKFYGSLQSVSKVMGHCYHTVIEIELQRQKIDAGQPFKELLKELLNMLPKSSATTEVQERVAPAVVNVATEPVPSSSPGLMGYLSERYKMKILKEIAIAGKTTPEITTAKKPDDILDYCRDIPRECNRLFDNYLAASDMVEIFPDENTRKFLTSELRIFLGKLCNIIVGFTTAICDYRTELLGYRQTAYAQAITMLKMAEYQSLGGMTKSDLIQRMLEVAGPERADGKISP